MIKEPLSQVDRSRLPHPDDAALFYTGTEAGAVLESLFLLRAGSMEPVDAAAKDTIVDVVVADGPRSTAFLVARKVLAGEVTRTVVGWKHREDGRPVDELARLLEQACPTRQ